MFSQNSATESLFKAIEYNEPASILGYLKRGADLKALKNNMTPVKYAVSLKQWKTIKIIADYLSDNHISIQPSFFDKDPYDLLHALEKAIPAGEEECLASLKYPGIQEEKNATNQLFRDIHKGESRSIIACLNRGANLNDIQNGATPILLAVSLGHWNIVESILDYLIVSQISVKPSFFENDPFRLGHVLKRSILAKQFVLAYKLIKAGVNLEVTDITDELMSSMKKKKKFYISLNLKDRQDALGITALYAAVWVKQPDLILALLKAGARPNQPSVCVFHVSGKINSDYPLHLAIRSNLTKIAATLSFHKANENLRLQSWKPFTDWDGQGDPYHGFYNYGQTLTDGPNAEDVNKENYRSSWILSAHITQLAEKVFLTLLVQDQINSMFYSFPLEVWNIILTDLFSIMDDQWTYSLDHPASKMLRPYVEKRRLASINNFVSSYNLPFFGKSQESKDLVAAIEENKQDGEKVETLKYSFFKERFTTGTYNPESRAIRYMKENGVTNDYQIEEYYQQCIKQASEVEEFKIEEIDEEEYVITNTPKKPTI